MPLWALFIRPLAHRQVFQVRLQGPRCQGGERWLPRRIASYSTALQQNRPDDEPLPPVALSSSFSDSVKQDEALTAVLVNAPGIAASPQSQRIRRYKASPSKVRNRRLVTARSRFRLVRSDLRSSGAKTTWLRARAMNRARASKVHHRNTLLNDTQEEKRRGRLPRDPRQRFRWQRTQLWTIARFGGQGLGLRRRRTVRGRIWSTANPYTLTKTWPFHATATPTARAFTFWQSQYSRIASFYAKYREREAGETPSISRLLPEAPSWAEGVLARLDSGQRVINFHGRRLGDVKWLVVRWEQVALWMLTYRPERMIEFLLATNAHEGLERHHFEDTLLQLARVFKHRNDTVRIRELCDAFCTILEDRPDRRLYFMNEFVRILMQRCSDEQILRLFEAVRGSDVKLHPYAWLHFATYFARNNEFETALKCLLTAHQNGANLNGYAFRSNCATLLRKSSEQPDGLRVSLRVVTILVDIGVVFNLPICNVIMLNAVEAGDWNTAFAVYRSLKERGLQADEITYLVLLKGCRMNIDDAQLLEETIRDAIANMDVRRNEKVATEILHCLALHHSKHNPDTALHTLAEAYAQLFDLTPLWKLDLPISSKVQKQHLGTTPMPPTRHAMTFMIGAAVQHWLAQTPRSTDSAFSKKPIVDLYVRWRKHVENTKGDADPDLASLASTDHLANIFLSAFIRTQQSLLFAARVVRDMQRPLPPGAIAKQSKPTVQTWSIFLRGFTQHNQMKLAEQVLTYMRQEGIEPNQVTWNTLTSGYARMQDAENAAETLRRAEREGMVWDVWTHKGLRRLRDREKLDDELRKRRLAGRLDFTDDLKAGLEERLGEQPRREPQSQVSDQNLTEVEPAGLENGTGRVAEQGLDSNRPLEPQREKSRPKQRDIQREDFGDSPGEIAEQCNDSYRPFG